MKRPVPDRPDVLSTLGGNGILDLAVNGTKLAVERLLGLVDNAKDAVLHILGNDRTGLVTAVGDNVAVVGRATTVPGEELEKSQLARDDKRRDACRVLTLGVSVGMSVRAPSVATVIRASFSFLGVISATA